MIPPKRDTAWRRLIAVAVVVVALVAATLFAFRREIATMMSYEARASTPVQMTAAPPPRLDSRRLLPRPLPQRHPRRRSSAPPPATPAPPHVRPGRPQVEAARPNIEVDLDSSKIDVVDGRYVVRGQLVNNGKAVGSTTLLRLTFKNNEDVLGERSFSVGRGPLPPGGRASFSQALDDPPSGTTDIVPAVE